MIMIIDGYNVLFHDAWPSHGMDLEQRRENLIQELSQYRFQNKIRRVIVVFDGQMGTGPHVKGTVAKGVEIVYAVGDGKADDKIVDLCGALQGVCVITADRNLSRRVKRFGAAVISTEEFLREWKKNRQETRMTFSSEIPDEQDMNVDDWLEVFGLEEEVEIPNAQPGNLYHKLKKKKKGRAL